MNNQTNVLLQQLANKLGTTTEYLWAILLKQAAVDATTTLCYFIFIVFGGVLLYKLNKKFMRRYQDPNYSSNQTCDYEEYEPLGFVMFISTCIWAIMFIVIFFSLSDIVNGYFNPEYWALDKVLSTLKS